MSDGGIGFDTSAFDDDGAPKPLTVARIAVSRAAEDLAHAADQLLAVERDADRARDLAASAERRAIETERALEESEHKVVKAERRAEHAERLVTQTQDRIRSAEERLAAAEERASAAEERGGAQAEQRIRATEERAVDAEERLEIEVARGVELSRRLEEATRAAVTADERADAADERAHVSLERTKQLEAEVDALRAALDELRKAPPVTVIVDEARTALQEAVAAEVRRPLSSIMGPTLAIKHHDASTSDGQEMVRQLSMHARKLDRLVAEYLELDRLIDGSLKPNRRRTDLEALVRRVAEDSPDLDNIDVRIESSRASVAVDPVLAEQIVEALLANAGRRTAPGNAIRVKVWQDERGATIAVEDTGEPVSAALREALLDPAQLLRSGAPKGGTGLILMSRLAQIHRGRATVEELPDGGASFRVFLPAVVEAEGPDASEGRTGGEAQPTLEDGAIAI